MIICWERISVDRQCNAENAQLRFGSPRRDPFFDPLPPLFGFRPILGNYWARSTNQSFCLVAARSIS